MGIRDAQNDRNRHDLLSGQQSVCVIQILDLWVSYYKLLLSCITGEESVHRQNAADQKFWQKRNGPKQGISSGPRNTVGGKRCRRKKGRGVSRGGGSVQLAAGLDPAGWHPGKKKAKPAGLIF